MPNRSIQAIVFCASVHSLAMAGGITPDAGAMLGNAEGRVAMHQTQPVEGLPVEYYPRLGWTDDFSIQVQSVVVQGNAMLPNDKIQTYVKGFVGKRLSVERLSTVTNAVMRAYKEAGLKARAYVPEQNFARGKLIVQVIEVPSP